MVASEFMYDNCRVNIGYEHGDKSYNTIQYDFN